MAKFFGTLPCAFAAPLAAGSQADGQISASPISPLLASDFSPYALASGLYRRVIEPISMTITATGLGVAATMGVKNLAEDTKRINHYEAHPSKNCYAVCGGQKTLSPADGSKKKFPIGSSHFTAAPSNTLFEDDDVWGRKLLWILTLPSTFDYAVEDALKKSPLSSESPLRPYQKQNARTHQHDSQNVQGGAGQSAQPDEVKHVKVGGGLINKFRPAEKMRASAQEEVDAQVAAGGCAVVHNKINGQHVLQFAPSAQLQF
ncbi:hypothetical protein DFJ73DRAFT_771700 [Zopfochytrium polystomum]|nr:hypothetical protein DFJ73DRAFT_771700 [Zopfochytrium polystomum]